MELVPIGHFSQLKMEPVEDNTDPLAVEPPSNDSGISKSRIDRLLETIGSLKQNYTQAKQTISNLSKELEKKIRENAELEEKLIHQNQLLLHMETDHGTDKAIWKAERETLKGLLDTETKKRIELETTQNRKWEQRDFEKGTGTDDENMEVDNEQDDVMVVKMVDNAKSKGRPSAFFPWVQSIVKEEPVVQCETCGVAFNAGWKLLEHVKKFHPFESMPKVVENDDMNDQTEPRASSSGYCLRDRSRLKKARTLVSEGNEEQLSTIIEPVDQEPLVDNMSDKEYVASISEKKFKCGLCEQRFSSLAMLKKHKKSAHDVVDDKYIIGCMTCGTAFQSRRAHQIHRRDVHGTRYGNAKRNLDSISNQRTVTNPQTQIHTGKPFTRNLLQLRHGVDQESTQKAGPNQTICLCGCSFRSLQVLLEHIRLFQSNPNLQQQCRNQQRQQPPHKNPPLLSHKIFCCKLCPLTFIRHDHLKAHVMQVHKVIYAQGVYACGCNQKFESNEKLINHKMLHCKFRRNSQN